MTRTHATFYNDRLTVTASGVSVTRSKPPRGSGERWHKGFRNVQRQRICRAADYLVASRQCDFITLTFPRMASSHEMICYTRLAGFTQIVEDDAARKYLRRFLRAMGYESYVWVAEVQPKRLKNRDERAIHFHLVVPRCSQALETRRAAVNTVWATVLACETVITDVQEAYGTPGAYLAKYMAKSHKYLDRDTGELMRKNGLKPEHWIQGNGYGMSHDVTAELKPVASMVAEGLHVDELTEHLEVAVYAMGSDYRRVDGRLWSSMEWGHNKSEYCQIFWQVTNHLLSSGIKCESVLNENLPNYPGSAGWGRHAGSNGG